MKKLIQKEIKKLSETDNIDSRFFKALNQAGFSDDEQKKITDKPVPSFSDIKPKPRPTKSKEK